MHSLAISRGYTRIREWLAKEGKDILVEAASVEILNRIQGHSGGSGFIIDGVYDSKLPSILRSNFPSLRIILISVLADNGV